MILRQENLLTKSWSVVKNGKEEIHLSGVFIRVYNRKIYKYCRRAKSMTYTEIKERNGRRYFYRVISVRKGKKVGKKRIYLGVNLSEKSLKHKEKEANKEIIEEEIRKNICRLKEIIVKILKKYKVKRAGIFGSYVRGEQKKNSDIDILITHPESPKAKGFGFIRIEYDLEKALKRKVDLITYNSLSPYIKDKILKEEIRIL